MADLPKRTDLLMVGMSLPVHNRVIPIFRQQMLGEAWLVVSEPAPTFGDARELTKTRRELEIIHISDQVGWSLSEMGQGCIELAAILATHPNKPWVTLGEMSLNYLATPFLRQQITVPQIHSSDLVSIIKRRWEHKNRLPRLLSRSQ